MRASVVTFSLAAMLFTPAAFAQTGRRPGIGPFAPAAAAGAPGASSSPKADPKVFPANTELPTPTPFDQIQPASIALPNDPIEPWLLTKDAGPFMVMAKTFRGEQAERYALVLAMELRRDFGLPAYILRKKDFPMGSNIRNIPPTAPRYVNKSQLTEPEKVRSYDEAMVLVGNEKTLQDSLNLLHKVQKIHPKCLDGMPTIFNWRKGTGLATATRTTNPYVPTQDLYPGRTQADTLVAGMNSGPRSIKKCPGRYTIQVAEFGGRTVFNPTEKDARLFGDGWLKGSPLRTAGNDAERLAEKLSNDPEIRRTGYQAYVYHDRSSSRVMVGAFNNPDDPAAVKLREQLLRLAVPLADEKRAGQMIAPASKLTDLEAPEHNVKAN